MNQPMTGEAQAELSLGSRVTVETERLEERLVSQTENLNILVQMITGDAREPIPVVSGPVAALQDALLPDLLTILNRCHSQISLIDNAITTLRQAI